MAAIKVMIVEDSKLVADVLKDTLESDKRVRVVGIAANGQQAIEMISDLAPDLVTMDVWMPVMDGFETVEWIMANRPTPILVITSSKLKEDVQISLRMLAAGALDIIEKPVLTDENHWKQTQAELLSKVRLLAGVRVITHIRGKLSTVPGSLARVTPKPPPVVTPVQPKPLNVATSFTDRAKSPAVNQLPYLFPPRPYYKAIGIASSTGGPTALLHVLQNLPANLPCPIFIVQHISMGFTQGLVDWLQREVKLKVKIGQDNDKLQPGVILLAPDGLNMLVDANHRVLTLPDPNRSNILCPNADALFFSLASVFGSQAIGIVLTGMGSDGAKGLKSIYQAGGYTIAQDETSSLIYGMPKVAAESGAAREVLPLDSVSSRLIELLHQSEIPDQASRGKE